MIQVTEELVRRLVRAQFAKWARLPVAEVEPNGWDNRTFRLGEDMSVRLPSAERYAAQVEKEQKWLPVLAPKLPLAIPTPLAMGAPGHGYRWHWSVYRWIDGESADLAPIDHLTDLATALGKFLAALQQIDPTGGPPPGPHNFFRGGPLTTYDTETRDAISVLRTRIDHESAVALWETALDAPWNGTPVWLHGDVSAGNLLVRDGRLHAVIDFGCCGVGDPSCDTAIAWTLFAGESREAFRAALPLDDATWRRGRGWALWKALITLAATSDINASTARDANSTLTQLLIDFRQSP